MANRLHAVDTHAVDAHTGELPSARQPVTRTHRRIPVPRARALLGAPPGPAEEVAPTEAGPPVRYLVRRKPPAAPERAGPPGGLPADGAAELVDAVRLRLAEAGADRKSVV